MANRGGNYRLFIKVHHGFPEHPKTVALSDRAFRNLVELWCYCARNLTDGIVPTAVASKFLSSRSRQELLGAPYIAEHPDGVEMLDYLEHQTSKAEIADLHRERSEAGKRGGNAKANRVASATASATESASKRGSKRVAEVEVEVEVEELLTTPVVTLGGATPPVASAVASATPAARGTRIDPSWQPSPDLIAWVRQECPHVDGRVQTANFIDYWVAKSGKDATKIDWAATYRKWMREEESKAGRFNGHSRPSTTDQRVGAALSLASRLAAQEQATRPQLGA